MASAPDRLWILTPVYFDSESFRLLRERILATLEAESSVLAERVSFIVVDDSAGLDASIDALDTLPDTRVLHVPFNLGHQRAIVYGLRRSAKLISATDYVVTLDSDGEDRAEDLPRLLEPLTTKPAALKRLVVASRTKRRESIAFKAMYVCFKIMFRVLTGTLIRNGNFAAFRGWLVHKMLGHPTFDLCYSSSLARLQLPDRRSIPCERGRRLAGESKMSYNRLVVHGFWMLMPFMDRIAVRALVSFAATFVLGLVLAAGVAGIRLLTDLAIPGWATTTALLFVVLSFIAVGNFAILFTLFAQTTGVLLKQIDVQAPGPTGDADSSR